MEHHNYYADLARIEANARRMRAEVMHNGITTAFAWVKSRFALRGALRTAPQRPAA